MINLKTGEQGHPGLDGACRWVAEPCTSDFTMSPSMTIPQIRRTKALTMPGLLHKKKIEELVKNFGETLPSIVPLNAAYYPPGNAITIWQIRIIRGVGMMGKEPSTENQRENQYGGRERRRTQRQPMTEPLFFRVVQGVSGGMEDISPEGMSITAPSYLSVGTAVEIALLGDSVCVDAHVRSAVSIGELGYRIGLAFTQPQPDLQELLSKARSLGT